MDLSQIFQAISSLTQAVNSINGLIDEGIELITSSDYPAESVPIVGASGNVANATATATLAAASGMTTYISGFDITSTGATAASAVIVTVANTTNSSMTFAYGSVAGANVANTPLSIRFPRPIPANTENLAITVTLPALGIGNTRASVVAYGYRI